MSDDSFIREVNEELRQDQAKALWDRYGPAFIGLALIVVLSIVALVFLGTQISSILSTIAVSI